MRGLFCLVRHHLELGQVEFSKELGIGLRHLQAVEYGEKQPSRALLLKCLRQANGAPLEQLRRLSPAAPALGRLAGAMAAPVQPRAARSAPLMPGNALPQAAAQGAQA